MARAQAILSTLESGAALPSGKHATMRGRTKNGNLQLDLFAPSAAPETKTHAAVEMLKAVEIDRLTPLDALTFVAKLKAIC